MCFGDCETPLVCEGNRTGKFKDSFFVWVVRSDIDVLLRVSASCTLAVFTGNWGGSAGELVSIVISTSFLCLLALFVQHVIHVCGAIFYCMRELLARERHAQM